jgi:NAD(P)H-flavin reductase
VLILGVRFANELLFKEEFLNFAKKYPRFKFYACYSQDKKIQLEDFEHLGRVQDIFKNLNLNLTQDIVYLCGNPNMIDDTFALLTNLGFDRKSIRREKYLFSH